jgi:peptidoglycan/LPS O-acetylase OafA/YrhL
MLHGAFVLVIMNGLADKALHLRTLPMIGVAAVCYSVVLLAAYVSFRYVETPARRWIDGFRLNERKAVGTAA